MISQRRDSAGNSAGGWVELDWLQSIGSQLTLAHANRKDVLAHVTRKAGDGAAGLTAADSHSLCVSLTCSKHADSIEEARKDQKGPRMVCKMTGSPLQAPLEKHSCQSL